MRAPAAAASEINQRTFSRPLSTDVAMRGDARAMRMPAYVSLARGHRIRENRRTLAGRRDDAHVPAQSRRPRTGSRTCHDDAGQDEDTDAEERDVRLLAVEDLGVEPERS